MNTKENARLGLRRAEIVLEEAGQLKERGVWDLAVRRSQEAVEKSSHHTFTMLDRFFVNMPPDPRNPSPLQSLGLPLSQYLSGASVKRLSGPHSCPYCGRAKEFIEF